MQKKATIYATGDRGVYVGRLEPKFRRACASSTLLVSLEDSLEVQAPNSKTRQTGSSFLIPAGTDVQIHTRGAHVALFFLDDCGTDLKRLQQRMTSVVNLGDQHLFLNVDGESEAVEFANILRSQRPSLATANDIVEDWLAHPGYNPEPPDPRIARAVQLVKQHHERNISVEWIAREVGLSVPRLTQLFRKVTGCPIRRFRLWHRVFVTAARLNQGTPLTEAALAAGFADYPQFSRTYRQLVGASPSDARNNTELNMSGYLG